MLFVVVIIVNIIIVDNFLWFLRCLCLLFAFLRFAIIIVVVVVVVIVTIGVIIIIVIFGFWFTSSFLLFAFRITIIIVIVIIIIIAVVCRSFLRWSWFLQTCRFFLFKKNKIQKQTLIEGRAREAPAGETNNGADRKHRSRRRSSAHRSATRARATANWTSSADLSLQHLAVILFLLKKNSVDTYQRGLATTTRATQDIASRSQSIAQQSTAHRSWRSRALARSNGGFSSAYKRNYTNKRKNKRKIHQSKTIPKQTTIPAIEVDRAEQRNCKQLQDATLAPTLFVCACKYEFFSIFQLIYLFYFYRRLHE